VHGNAANDGLQDDEPINPDPRFARSAVPTAAITSRRVDSTKATQRATLPDRVLPPIDKPRHHLRLQRSDRRGDGGVAADQCTQLQFTGTYGNDLVPREGGQHQAVGDVDAELIAAAASGGVNGYRRAAMPAAFFPVGAAIR
jgi:hypothetical protein